MVTNVLMQAAEGENALYLAPDFVIDSAQLCAVFHHVTYRTIKNHSHRLQRHGKRIASAPSQYRDNEFAKVRNDLSSVCKCRQSRWSGEQSSIH